MRACAIVLALLSVPVLAQTGSHQPFIKPKAESLSVSMLYGFTCPTDSSCPDGAIPVGQLVQGYDGDFYGVAEYGGTYGPGIIYRVTPSGTFTVVYNFCPAGEPCADGDEPNGLIQGGDGNLYGTTYTGGAHSDGVLFRFVPSGNSGTLTVLYSFCSVGGTACSDGAQPEHLIQGSDGNFYGVTLSYGGANGSSGRGGTVFKFAPATSTLTTIYQFCANTDCTDGANPNGVLEGSDGNFYGSFYSGGVSAKDGASGLGGVYKYIPSPSTFTSLYDFCATVNSMDQCIDGGFAQANVIEAADGTLYGSIGSGSDDSNGDLFSLTTAGIYTALYHFSGGADGGDASYTLFQGSDGAYYGSDETGASGYGTFFNFTVASDVATINTYYTPTTVEAGGPILQGADGNFYGVDDYPGPPGSPQDGGVYKVTVSPALPGPVQLTASSASINNGSSATLTWTVANAYSLTMQQCYAFVQGGAVGAGTWTGQQSVALNSKTGTYGGSASLTPTRPGTYTYALTCGGIETGLATLEVIGKTATVVVSATPIPLSVGQTITVKATVSGGNGTPTGSAAFYTGSDLLATVPLSNGVASFTASTTTFPAGTYAIDAVYSGDAVYNTETSAKYTVTLNKAVTSTTLTASPNPVTPPAMVTLTATVKRTASGDAGTPTGTVTFLYAGNALGTVNLNTSGVAALSASTSAVPAATYTVTAKYAGDSSDVASSSSGVSVEVK